MTCALEAHGPYYSAVALVATYPYSSKCKCKYFTFIHADVQELLQNIRIQSQLYQSMHAADGAGISASMCTPCLRRACLLTCIAWAMHLDLHFGSCATFISKRCNCNSSWLQFRDRTCLHGSSGMAAVASWPDA